MATDASTTPFDSLSYQEHITQQQEATKTLENPDTVKKFIQECTKAGQAAVAVYENFTKVKNGFAELVNKYGNDFPDVGGKFVPKWDGFMAVSDFSLRYCPETNLLHTSVGTENQGSSDYDENLEIIADIKSTEDLKDAQDNLKQYVQKHPIRIATEVADGFKDLANDVQDFSKDFTKYVGEQNVQLTEDAERYEGEIEKFQKEITELNEKMKKAGISFGVTAIFLIFALIPAGFLIKYALDRDKAQAKLDKAKADLAQTVRKQKALAAMQADFEGLKPSIDDICQKLGIFAYIWAFATEQSTEINVALNGGMEVTNRKKFQVKLRFLRAQIKPLQEGMRQYATQISKSK
ncbi:hypothetical protein AGABI2DRAFT_181811 [Agaricus bisporus var. bisporus H97]|uniref:hypothetical protein n=1 Tax=Agaricus bisporus var. bisporus (strain H97 / ATCC MYA-4626 / FGSC 10389) TaxID=936046 RepID=UPI00029F5813|nr:hypothetical protein AGABI2DRAFT_181811 [Agaricus bisporus var. bisporus H97]EKV41599.1 hypothetical protein AGABI2DRAFT_181811 [Agaricus bisporus var. bisporus H97]